jgi:5-formyltetrahydrofolate cyclo-ligase
VTPDATGETTVVHGVVKLKKHRAGRYFLTSWNKTEWRAWAKHLRSRLPDVSESVCSHLEGWLPPPSLANNEVSNSALASNGMSDRASLHFLAYHAFADEIRLEPLIEVMPFVTWLTTRVNPGKRLSLHAFSSATLRNRYGILEPPADQPELDPGVVDVALVPGLVFDARGTRLGFGAGFYDRLLSSLRAGVPIIGVTRDALVVPELPSEAHDVLMTHLVTESGVRQIDRAFSTD